MVGRARRKGVNADRVFSLAGWSIPGILLATSTTTLASTVPTPCTAGEMSRLPTSATVTSAGRVQKRTNPDTAVSPVADALPNALAEEMIAKARRD